MGSIQIFAQAEYAALRAGAAIQLRLNGGVLALTDADRSDFLHRLTTNNIHALKPGQATVTVLTSPTARILFVFTVICRPDALWLLPAKGQAQMLARYLAGQIFFMDKVKVANISSEQSRLRVVGAQADDALAALGFDLRAEPDGAWQEGNGVLALKQLDYDLPGYELIAPTAQQAALLDKLKSAGAVVLNDEKAYTARRVEMGRPAPGYELTEEYNPLEAGLGWACAENKGCYTGQEIIARQVAYDKVTKTLIGLFSDSHLSAGAEVTAGERVVGAVTSAAFSPALQRPIALAIVKRPYNQPGSKVMVGELPAQTAVLPFVI
jgi:folate-binding protein YgfZ